MDVTSSFIVFIVFMPIEVQFNMASSRETAPDVKSRDPGGNNYANEVKGQLICINLHNDLIKIILCLCIKLKK